MRSDDPNLSAASFDLIVLDLRLPSLDEAFFALTGRRATEESSEESAA